MRGLFKNDQPIRHSWRPEEDNTSCDAVLVPIKGMIWWQATRQNRHQHGTRRVQDMVQK
jgi:hypothetical protein